MVQCSVDWRVAVRKKICKIGDLVTISAILGWGFLIFFGAMIGTLLWVGSPGSFSFKELLQYPDFLWNPQKLQFSIIPFICGTILVAALSLLISIPFSICLGIASWLTQHNKKKSFFLEVFLDFVNGIPPVVWGMLGLFFLTPSVMSATFLCSLLSIPFLSICVRDTLSSKTGGQYLQQIQEESYALGAGHFETIFYIVFPYKKNVLASIFLLGLGRALGEATAVSMLIGSRNFIPKNIFSPGQTITGVITTEFSETLSDSHLNALMLLGLILFVITTLVNLIGEIFREKIDQNCPI